MLFNLGQQLKNSSASGLLYYVRYKILKLHNPLFQKIKKGHPYTDDPFPD